MKVTIITLYNYSKLHAQFVPYKEMYVHVLHIVPKTTLIVQFKIHIRTHK
jgi:hypothetical protein